MTRILWILPFAAGLLTGCTTAADPGCVSDSECYAGRVCVDARCTGDVPLSRNNSDNGSSNIGLNNVGNNTPVNNIGNNVPANITPNNEPTNSEFNNQNNVPPPDFCTSAQDCNNDLVCSSTEDGLEVPQCVQPWPCVLDIVDGDFDFCLANWLCEPEGYYEVFCEFGDRDEGFCTCIDLETGEGRDFEANRNLCVDPARAVDELNINCGWRLPRF